MDIKRKFDYKDRLNQYVLKNILIRCIPILNNVEFNFIEKDEILNNIYNKIDNTFKTDKNSLLIETFSKETLKSCYKESVEICYKEIMKLKQHFCEIKDFTNVIFFIEFK